MRRVVETGFGPKVTDEIRRVRQIWKISILVDRSGNARLETKVFDVLEEGQESQP